MKNQSIIIAIIFLGLSQIIGMQNINACRINRVDRQMQRFEYSKSIVLLKKIIKRDGKNSTRAKEEVATAYRLSNKPDSAVYWYAEAIKADDSNNENYFHYGQMLRTLGDYENAKVQFLKYDALVPDNDKEASKLAAYCDRILKEKYQAPKYRIKNAQELNTAFSDFSPYIYNEGIVFTSDRPHDLKRKKTYAWTGSSYLNLYSSQIDFSEDDLKYTASDPKLVAKDLLQTYHDGTAVFSKNGDMVIYTRTYNEKVKNGESALETIVLKMYVSNSVDGEWTEAKPFYLNSDSYSVGHPTLSSDGTLLYFVSDMPNGFGGTDLYVCSLENGQWSDVQNLGGVVNTKGNEMFPYMDASDHLYFSSTNHFGYGGLDLFRSRKSTNGWEEPQNLGLPLNSSYDDFGLCFIKGSTGFFSSNRPEGMGDDDIYAFDFLRPISLTGRVVSDNDSVLQDATVFLLNENTDQILILKTDSLGKYSTVVDRNTSYTILSKKNTYLNDCLNIEIKDKPKNPVDLVLIQVAEKKKIAVENIYYDLDKWFIREDAKPTLDHIVKVMNENPIKIELGSHTDSRASEAYNIKLSQRRAEAAVNYILYQGIDSARISAKGYGETMLVNACSDDVDCTEEAHQLNRRTEFTIIEVESIKEVTKDELLKYKAGDSYNIKEFEPDFFEECE